MGATVRGPTVEELDAWMIDARVRKPRTAEIREDDPQRRPELANRAV